VLSSDLIEETAAFKSKIRVAKHFILNYYYNEELQLGLEKYPLPNSVCILFISIAFNFQKEHSQYSITDVSCLNVTLHRITVES
jgi:hypothetical protein